MLYSACSFLLKFSVTLNNSLLQWSVLPNPPVKPNLLAMTSLNGQIILMGMLHAQLTGKLVNSQVKFYPFLFSIANNGNVIAEYSLQISY